MQTTLLNTLAPGKLSLKDQWFINSLCLGPIFLGISIAHVRTENGPLALIVSLYPLVGMVLLSHGLMGLYTRLTRILARLDALEKR